MVTQSRSMEETKVTITSAQEKLGVLLPGNMVSGTAGGSLRVMMYSHDGFGLGHYRRMLKLSTFLRKELPKVTILLITGSSMAHAFDLPPGVDYVKLPCVSKESNEVYAAKYLSLSFREIKSIREQILLGTTLAYQPHILIVDKHPLGMKGEVLPTLRALKANQQKTKVVLGVRDILDDPQEMVPYFQTHAVRDALENIYDEIWIYGCRSLFDPIKEYHLTDTVAQKVKFCGYLPCEIPSSPPVEVRRELGVGEGKFILVTAGAGGDGFSLLDTYLKALDFLPKEREIFSLLVCGPDMPPRERESLRRRCTEFTSPWLGQAKLLEFTPRIIEYMSAADVVVSMGGYNTLLEVISLGKEAVVVPRINPRREQLLRAAAFEKRGLIRLVHPDHLSPRALARTTLDALQTPAVPFSQRLEAAEIDLKGLERVKNRLLHLLTFRDGERNAVL